MSIERSIEETISEKLEEIVRIGEEFHIDNLRESINEKFLVALEKNWEYILSSIKCQIPKPSYIFFKYLNYKRRFERTEKSRTHVENNIRELIKSHPQYSRLYKRYVKERQRIWKGLREYFDKLNCCSTCTSCCCGSFDSYLDWRDHLYRVLTNQSLPNITFQSLSKIIKENLEGNKRTLCMYLTPKGCCLPYDIRPDVCVSYKCDKQEAELKKLKLFTKYEVLLNDLNSDKFYNLSNEIKKKIEFQY